MVKPCWLLIEKQELANKETGTFMFGAYVEAGY